MKIAVVSDDGVRLSRHFGRAPYYVVFTVQDGKITQREVRSKVYHGQGEHPSHDGNIHAQMASPLADCKVLLAGGMGAGAYQSLCAQGVQPAFVDSLQAEDAVADYLAGRTMDHPLCQH